MPAKNYSDLIAWQKAMDFTSSVYTITKSFPSDEKFGLTAQLRRASVSIPSNIAEGEGRLSPGDFRRFLTIAHGSLRESETQLLLAQRFQYADSQTIDNALDHAAEVGRLIQGLIRSIDKK